MKVKLLNEDEMVGYVSIKKLSARPNNYKYKLTFNAVMANQNSNQVARIGYVEATSEQDAVRQVTAVVSSAQPFEGEQFLMWVRSFGDSLRRAYPVVAA